MSSRRGPGQGPSNSVILRAGAVGGAGSLMRQPARSAASSLHRWFAPQRGQFAGSSIRLDREGVKPGRELGRQGLVYGPVAGDARQAGENRGPDPDRIMRLAARRCAGMTVMQMRLIVDFQQVR